MTISTAIQTYVTAQGAFSSLASDRLYPERADQDEDAPYVVYHIELTDAAPTMDGPTLMIEAALNFIVLSKSYDEAFEIAEALRGIMSDFKGVMGGASGIQVESLSWEGTEGGYIARETSELGLFGALVKFVLQYIPQ